MSKHAPGLDPEERPDVGIQHPAHLSPVKPHRQGIQRIVLAAFGAEPIGEPDKVRLVDSVQDSHHRSLDNLVLQRGDPERAQAPIRFGDVLTPRRQCPVCAPLNPSVQVCQSIRQACLVLGPCHAIDAGGRGLLQLEEGPVQ